MKAEEKLALLNIIFSPSAPIENVRFFRGRDEQFHKIKEAIEERGRHAVMYGGRGVGKTSLANVLGEVFSNIVITKVTCNHSDTFFSIWNKALRSIKLISAEQSVGYKPTQRKTVMDMGFPEEMEIDATTIEGALNYIEETLLIVFDEYDSVVDKATKQKMADTIKALSDNVPHATLLILGVADNVVELLGDHPSLERCVMQIRLPEMKEAEGLDIINKGLKNVGLRIDAPLADKIVEYSCGFPHYIHLLCKFAAKNAIENKQKEITDNDFKAAVSQSIENSSQSLVHSFRKATASARQKNQFEDVIVACALVATAHSSTFSPDEVVEKFNEMTNSEIARESINYNLGMLCKADRGNILLKSGSRKTTRYKFRNPLMKAYLKLVLHEKLVGNESIPEVN